MLKTEAHQSNQSKSQDELGRWLMIKSEQVERLVEISRQFLSEQKEPVSERDLLIELTRHGMFDGLGKSSAIIKQFQKHFLTMHALYRLQERLEDTQYRLHIRPEAIILEDLNAPEQSTAELDEEEQAAIAEAEENDEALRDYYLDLNQLKLYNGSVGSTPDDYKRRYNSSQHKDSYAALDLNAGANWVAVQSAYRQKAVQCHPDKGGNAQDFQRVRDAYQDLKRTLRP